MASQRRIAAIANQLRPNVSQLTTLETNATFHHGSDCKHESKCPAISGNEKKPVKVLVTGAAGNIGYSLVFMVANGDMLGPDQPINLVLLDIKGMEKVLDGLIMELLDCAFPLLHSVIGTTDYQVAFSNVEYALLVGARPRGPGMQRKDLLQANAEIFSGQGKALNNYASKNVKVLVVGNPANTNALIAMNNAPNLPKTAFSALTRLDQNRAQSQIAARLKLDVDKVKNVIIWGNHSNTQYPDVNHAVVIGHPQSFSVTPVRSAVNDNEWLNTAFVKSVQERGAAIISARGKSSAASAAEAAVAHMRDWVLGTKKGEYVSMAVYSDGKTYGIPEGLIFSFPCVCANGQYSIARGLLFDDFSKGKIKATTNELLEERKQALGK